MAVKLRRIEVFMAVVDSGGFSAAAEQLHIAQSAVSVSIRELERELGAQLFERSGRSIRLTESGRVLRERAQPALAQLYGVRQEIRDRDQLAAGRVRIVAPAMVTQFALRQVLPPFMQAFPGVQLQVAQAGAVETEQLVLRGEADLGVIAWRQLAPELDAVQLWELENIACLPLNHPKADAGRISWAALLAHPQAVCPVGYQQRVLVESYAAQLRLPLSIAIESDNIALLLAAVRAGCAVASLPSLALRGETGIACVKLTERQSDRLAVGICWSRRIPLSKAAQVLLDHLRKDALTPSRTRKPRRPKPAID